MQASTKPADIDDDMASAMESELGVTFSAEGRGGPGAAPSTVRPLPARRTAAPPLARIDDEVTRFLGTAERMFVLVRKQMTDAESAFNVGRVKLADQYQRRMTELQQEAAEAMRQFDAKHREDMAKRQRMLDALTAMRDA